MSTTLSSMVKREQSYTEKINISESKVDIKKKEGNETEEETHPR
jgi:hypothetical protein